MIVIAHVDDVEARLIAMHRVEYDLVRERRSHFKKFLCCILFVN